jgi:hypothetical protein
MVTEPERVLRAAHTVLVVDWPSRDVPTSVAALGFAVPVRGGPSHGAVA